MRCLWERVSVVDDRRAFKVFSAALLVCGGRARNATKNDEAVFEDDEANIVFSNLCTPIRGGEEMKM
tara:strand:- start:139 stop:339 length:201 start_codon:yes stop_codon:yes gene_type:complete